MLSIAKLLTTLSLAATSSMALIEVVGTHENLYLGAPIDQPLSFRFNRQDATYIAPHFAWINIPAGARLTIESPDGAQKIEYTNLNQTNFYTKSIQGDTALLTYTPPTNGTSGQDAFFVDKFAHGFPDASPDDVAATPCGKGNLRTALCLKSSDPIKYQKAQAIARLFIDGSGLCTGWLFGSEGHLVTNHHCIMDKATAGNTQFEFGAECPKCNENTTSASRFTCPGEIVATSSTIIYTSAENDFTLVKMNLEPGVSLAKYGYLQARASGPVLNEPIYITQHPSGGPTKIATALQDGSLGTIEDMSVRSCVKDEVAYSLFTQGGSSGSPVLSATENVVVALHNCGGCSVKDGSQLARGVKIDKVIAELTKANVLPKDALANGAAPQPSSISPTPTTESPKSTAAPTSTPNPTAKTTIVPTTAAPIPTPTYQSTTVPTSSTTQPQPTSTTQKPRKTCAPKSRKPATPSPSTASTPSTSASPQPSTVTPMKPTTTTPATKVPTPSGDCKGCTGCYSKSLGSCLSADYDKATCASYSYFQTIWCGN
ncbi:Aste57867_15667 [Aphanomyces stellatus]|uniref:Aste57867_15667 protein n=1 Tax=Aphanomyces stellatus TaxID=120398 RepID=A0A485L4K5_9STRA|nr:hypothetical protein As57867_015611 [Aphanomyces stellatus]VFT92461.1 Aste57867_15667 [Aphanomyces stellatus]